MQTAEFETEVRDGVIELPESLRGHFQHRVRVRLTAESPATSGETILDRWIKSPIEVPNFNPLTRDEAHER